MAVIRRSAGTPEGGQYAQHARTEPDVTLTETPAPLPDIITNYFNQGQCHAFALALNEHINGDIIWCGTGHCGKNPCDDEHCDCQYDACKYEQTDAALFNQNTNDEICPCQFRHIMVQSGEYYYDVRGRWNETDIYQVWKYETGYLTTEETISLGQLYTWMEPDIVNARNIIPAYIESLEPEERPIHASPIPHPN